jgi:hypothetical protein
MHEPQCQENLHQQNWQKTVNKTTKLYYKIRLTSIHRPYKTYLHMHSIKST